MVILKYYKKQLLYLQPNKPPKSGKVQETKLIYMNNMKKNFILGYFFGLFLFF